MYIQKTLVQVAAAQHQSKFVSIRKLQGTMKLMLPDDKNRSPMRLGIFESLDSLRLLDEVFDGKSGMEEAFIVEPDITHYKDLSVEPDFKKWAEDPRIEWIVGAGVEETPARFYHGLIRRNRHLIMRASAFIKSSRVEKNAPYFSQVEKHFQDTCNLVEVGRGYLESSLLAIKNTLDNLDLIEKNPGLQSLDGRFRNLPAVVISTGPSLSRSLSDLKKIQDHAVLICADASLKILLEADIVPHFVCTIERDEGTLPFYKDAFAGYQGPKPHIVTFSLAPRSVVNEMKAPLWFGYRNMSFFGFFEAQMPRGILSAGHSVAHFCTRLAKHIGCNEAVLVGQDLAYDPENFSSHSKGFSYEEHASASTLAELTKKVEGRGEQLSFVAGNSSPQVPTSTFYLMFLREFEALVRDIEIPVKNATRGGAKICGTTWGSLLSFAENWPIIDCPIEKLERLHEQSPREGHFSANLFLERSGEALQVVTQCSDILKRHLLHLADQNAKSVLLAIAQQLRGVQKKLLEDEIFRALTVDLVGTRFVQIENSLAQLWDNDPENLAQRFPLLIEWFSECRQALEKLNLLVSENTTTQYQRANK